MTPAFVVFARDKAPYVAETVRCILRQTYAPMDLVFSDQGSTDGTMEIMKREAQAYNGPNKVIFLECDRTERRGMHGLVDHLNWIHSRLDNEFWLISSADDLCSPRRAERTMQVLDGLDRKPLWFGTTMCFGNSSDEDAPIDGATAWPQVSKWVTPGEHLEYRVGGGATNAWSPELIEAVGGRIPDHCLLDMYLPFEAALRDRFYFLREELGIYIRRNDPNNTGLETRMKHAKDETELEQLFELAGYQLTQNAVMICRAAEDWHRARPDDEAASAAVSDSYTYLMHSAAQWAAKRTKLVRMNAAPAALPGRF